MDYNATVNLPKTDFPMRAGLPKREPDMLQAWYDLDLYHEMLKRTEGRPLFVLHDGPPFSNGQIHMGTALNKVLLMGTSKTEVKIVSEKSELIRDAILSKVDRGVTVLHGEGGYLHKSTEVIMSIVSDHEMPKIERLARDSDLQTELLEISKALRGGTSGI